MQKKQRNFWNGSGPYFVFAACLAAAGLLGARMLLPGENLVPEEPVIIEEPAPNVNVVREQPVEIASNKPDETPEKEQEQSPAPEQESVRFVSPLAGETIAAFSADALRYNEALADWRTHSGIDIASEAGSPVAAAAAGTVKSVTEDPLLGTTVVLSHSNGYESTYVSLAKEVCVSVGDTVEAGETLGAVAATAAGESGEPHLHFSVSCHGTLIDPADFIS